MKKVAKIVVWTLVSLVLFVVLAALTIPLWAGSVVKSVAASLVPGYTGTDFKMAHCSINPYSGRFEIGGLNLANPQGYDEPVAFSVASVSVDVNVLSLFTKRIHVREISIESPYVSYVFDAAGSNNFARIAAHAAAKSESKTADGAAAEAKPKDASAEKVRVVIDRLCVNGTWVKYRMLKLPIPVPTLTNIGKDDDDDEAGEAQGATLEEVRDKVWNAIKDSFSGFGAGLGAAAGAVGQSASNILKSASALLTSTNAVGSVTQGAAQTAKDVTQGTAQAAKSVAGGAADAVQGAAKGTADVAKGVADGAANAVQGVTDGAKNALKKVGNLFGK